MSDLYEFSAEEMRGVPSFWNKPLFGYFVSASPNSVNLINRQGDWITDNNYMCNPQDRMMAICKHLFDLMPISLKSINVKDGVPFIMLTSENTLIDGTPRGWIEPLSINPFIGTDKISITREEVEG